MKSRLLIKSNAGRTKIATSFALALVICLLIASPGRWSDVDPLKVLRFTLGVLAGTYLFLFAISILLEEPHLGWKRLSRVVGALGAVLGTYVANHFFAHWFRISAEDVFVVISGLIVGGSASITALVLARRLVRWVIQGFAKPE